MALVEKNCQNVLGGRVKVELDLSNYAKKKKADLKNATGVDKSRYDKKS